MALLVKTLFFFHIVLGVIIAAGCAIVEASLI